MTVIDYFPRDLAASESTRRPVESKSKNDGSKGKRCVQSSGQYHDSERCQPCAEAYLAKPCHADAYLDEGNGLSKKVLRKRS